MTSAETAATSPVTPAHLEYLTDPRWRFARWVQYLNDRVTEFLMRPGQGFMAVEAPVRHGKSRFCSRATPAWFLGMNPGANVLLATNSDSLSTSLSRQTRDLLVHYGPAMFGVHVRQDARAASNWRLDEGGGMRAVSRNGAIIGEGGDLIILDDPIRDVFEAAKRAERDRLYDWYAGVVRTRLEPDGKILLVMSRWHEDDLTGRLVDTPTFGGDVWERIHLPAIAEPAKWETVEDVDAWRDPIGRKKGEALWPQRWPVEKLNKVRSLAVWSGQYQQRPLSPGGDMFPRGKWGAIDEPPTAMSVVCRIDLAAGAKATSDFAAMSTVGRDRDGFTYILDVRRLKAEAHDVEQWVATSADEITERFPKVKFVVEQEPGSGGLMIADHFVRIVLARHSVTKKRTISDKIVNAQPLAAQVQAGNVRLLRERREAGYAAARWWSMFLDESSEFPKGTNDDMVDAASQAYNDLVGALVKRSAVKTTRPQSSLPASRF